MWISTFASVLSTSGKAGGCRQDSRSINDSLQRVSRHTVSSDLSLWRKQSMDWCSAQSDTLSSRPLPTRHVRKPSMFVWGEGGGCVAFIAFSPWILTSACSASVITSRKQLFHYDTLKKKKKNAFAACFLFTFIWFPLTAVLLKYSARRHTAAHYRSAYAGD